MCFLSTIISVIIALGLCIFSKVGPLLELHSSIKIFNSMIYPHLNNSVLLFLQHFQRFTFLCRCSGLQTWLIKLKV